jgi:hypothetical protein
MKRGHGYELARHLMNPRDNDMSRPPLGRFVADDLYGAFAEMPHYSGHPSVTAISLLSLIIRHLSTGPR